MLLDVIYVTYVKNKTGEGNIKILNSKTEVYRKSF